MDRVDRTDRMDLTDPPLLCHWTSAEGTSTLAVHRTPAGWELLAASPYVSESLPFDTADDVRALARALVELPSGPEPFEAEWYLAAPDSEGDQGHFATLACGLDLRAGHRPYLAYQAVHRFGSFSIPGADLYCDDLPLDRLRHQGAALLAALATP